MIEKLKYECFFLRNEINPPKLAPERIERET